MTSTSVVFIARASPMAVMPSSPRPFQPRLYRGSRRETSTAKGRNHRRCGEINDDAVKSPTDAVKSPTDAVKSPTTP
eukprot:4741763-Pyramimonas_sp.AAC.1